MNYQDKIKHIQTHFPMSVLLKKLNILSLNFNINHRFPCPFHQEKNLLVVISLLLTNFIVGSAEKITI
ncbi:hypothetical protein PAWBP_6300 [Paulownia witches'-broom phytoplasma]|nr:hypothetical protein PAWBP_6300 [Paulownia witches'-broom phytoplasma]